MAPVSTEIGPPSFPTSSAALEEEGASQPLVSTQLTTRGAQPPGGLSRSLSASASSSAGPRPNGTAASGTVQSGETILYSFDAGN